MRKYSYRGVRRLILYPMDAGLANVAASRRREKLSGGLVLLPALGRLMLPAAMKPEVLLGRLANERLERRRETLGDVLDGAGVAGIILGQDLVGHVDVVLVAD